MRERFYKKQQLDCVNLQLTIMQLSNSNQYRPIQALFTMRIIAQIQGTLNRLGIQVSMFGLGILKDFWDSIKN